MSNASDSDEPRDPATGKNLAELLRSAGPRPAPSAQAQERVKTAVYQAYVGQLQQRTRRHWLIGIAASLAALLVAGVLIQQRQPAQTVVAHITRTVGDAASVDAARAVPDQPVRTREAVSVAAGGRLLLTLTNGIGLRVNESTQLVFESPTIVRLDQGTVYVETPRDAAASSADFSIQTAYGAVRHIGTRFEVRVASDELRIRVREGTALFRDASGKTATVNGGEQLDYRSGVVAVVPGPGPASDAWGWAESVRPEYRIDGRTLSEALEWLAHEAGLSLEFTDEAARTRAREITLHGDVGALTPRQAIQAILTGTDLPYDIEQARILVGPR